MKLLWCQVQSVHFLYVLASRCIQQLWKENKVIFHCSFSWFLESLTASAILPLFPPIPKSFSVSSYFIISYTFLKPFFIFRNYTSSRRLCKPWSTRFHPQLPITLRCGRRLHPPTAMSARGCCGASPVRACAAPSVALSATRSARTCSMQIVYKVRNEIHPMMLWCSLHKDVEIHRHVLRNMPFRGLMA